MKPVCTVDGEWETRLIPTRSLRLPWQWIVTNLCTKQQDSGRATTEGWARDDAREALEAMRSPLEQRHSA